MYVLNLAGPWDDGRNSVSQVQEHEPFADGRGLPHATDGQARTKFIRTETELLLSSSDPSFELRKLAVRRSARCGDQRTQLRATLLLGESTELRKPQSDGSHTTRIYIRRRLVQHKADGLTMTVTADDAIPSTFLGLVPFLNFLDLLSVTRSFGKCLKSIF